MYIGLVHYPVLNKHGETVQTSVTNLDIHDISRSAVTYGVKNYFIITPDVEQARHVEKIRDFWLRGDGRSYNQDRSWALEVISIQDSVKSTIDIITTQEAMQPIVISTTARFIEDQISFEKMNDILMQGRPVLLLFGTGYGLTADLHQKADFVLQPVKGIGDYNHLSVRSALAVILDRITSAVYKGRN